MISLKNYAAILLLGLGVVSTAQASLITGQLYNTGLDSSGVAVATNGGTDGNWDVTVPAPLSDAITYYNGAYAANDIDSLWISSNANGGDETSSSTNYSFSTTFDLTGYDKDSAKITGEWGVDNYASIFLNGSNTGVSLSFGVDAFNSLSDFSIEDFFTDGINTLTVEVTNGYDTNLTRDPGPMALRFDDLALTATAVPAPGSLALLGLCLLGFGVSRRKQS